MDINPVVWKCLTFLFILLSVCLIIGIIVISERESLEDIPVCGKTSKSVSRTIDLSEPDRPGPFHDLTTVEIKNILEYVQNDPNIKAKRVEEARLTDSHVFMMDLLPAKKAAVWAYLDGKTDQPERHAKVVVFRGDLEPPVVQELDCGPLPEVRKCTLIKWANHRNPIEFSLRSYSQQEDDLIYHVLFKKVDKEIGYILRESYGMSYYDCVEPHCLLTYTAPLGSNMAEDINQRSMWLGAAYPLDYYSEHMLDFAVLANLYGTDPSKFNIYQVWYKGQFFESLDDFIVKYNQSSIAKTRMRPSKKNPRNLFSTTYRRGPPQPEAAQRPPTLVEPDGKRYSLKHRQVEYLGWKFNFRMSPFTGPSLNNIRFNDETIAYELSLSEIAIFYSGNNPLLRALDYTDSFELLGTTARSLVPGGDCPATSTFIKQTLPSQGVAEPVELDNVFCLFENNHGYPTHRHMSYSLREGAFYGGMLDSALTLRTIMTIENYDYVMDFIFHQTGTIQTRVMSTGYILSTFYDDSEKPYGFKTQKNLLGSLHHHLFHFKVDLDISGTSNRYETLDIKPEVVQMRSDPKPDYHQIKFDRTLHQTEKEALFKYNFNHPKYHIVHNHNNPTDYGEPKAYRILTNGISKQLIPEGKGNEPIIPWARYQMVVTKHKDEEQVSSTSYGVYDGLNPVVNFTKFFDDDENIVDEDLVFWLSLGVHHIPHSEDLPITPTVGTHLTFFISPYNYFPICPSMASRDHIQINLKDPKKPREGVAIDRHGYKDEQCKTPQLATQYEELLKDDPDVALESTH